MRLVSVLHQTRGVSLVRSGVSIKKLQNIKKRKNLHSGIVVLLIFPIFVGQVKVLTHRVFDKIFSIAELYNMDEETRLKILDSMTTERDLKNQLAYARKEGFAVGREEERRANATKLKALGVDVAIIAQATGLSVEEIALLSTLCV